ILRLIPVTLQSNSWRDASGRLTFDFSKVEAQEYPAVCRKIIDQFHLTQANELLVGPDQMFWDFEQNGLLIGLDWDIWMDFMVVAKNEESEPLVREIAAWLTGN